jgi:hypothetical protein
VVSKSVEKNKKYFLSYKVGKAMQIKRSTPIENVDIKLVLNIQYGKTINLQQVPNGGYIPANE